MSTSQNTPTKSSGQGTPQSSKGAGCSSRCCSCLFAKLGCLRSAIIILSIFAAIALFFLRKNEKISYQTTVCGLSMCCVLSFFTALSMIFGEKNKRE